MNFNFLPILWIHSAQLVIYLILALYVWDVKNAPGARYFMAVLVFAALWSLSQGLEIAALHLETKILWANLQYLAVMEISTLFLLYAMTFAKRYNHSIPVPLYSALLAVPFLIVIFVFLFPELVRSNVRLADKGGFEMIAKNYGPLFWLMSFYNYSISIVAIVTLIKAMREKSAVIRKQTFSVIAAAGLPVAANFLQVSGLNPAGIDISPVAFTISAVAITYGMVRYNLFRVVPIARYQVIKVMKAGMLVFDNDGALLDINPAAMRLLRIKDEPVGGEKIDVFLKDTPELTSMFYSKREQVREFYFKNGGADYCYELNLTTIRTSSGSEIGWLFQIYDITERKLAEEIIQQAAYHDNLTGLPNRQYFQLLFSQELALARLRGTKLAAGFIDIDDFKQINDGYGHAAGDMILRAITKRIRGELREGDIIGRLGGDEFAVVITGLRSKRELWAAGKRLIRLFERKVEAGELQIEVRVSIGFSMFPEDGESIDILLQKADMAMYEVKGSGKNNFRIYEEKKSEEQ